jgi:probable HAF family extracellular repeat protein
VSNSGFVAGCADAPDGSAHAFVYREGAMRDLGLGGGPEGGSSCALAVNNGGVAAGRSSSGELVVWNGLRLARLGVHGDVGAIDDLGVVVGSYRDGERERAFRTEGNTPVDLGSLDGAPGDRVHAARINTRGQIVGRSNGKAFLYESGVMRDLGTLGGTTANARGLNDRGWAVGMSSDGNGQPHAFLYDGGMRSLPAPGYASAIAVNNAGQVVGSAEGTHGFFVDADGVTTRLDTVPAVAARGWRHLEPTGLNDHGWIVGTAVTPGGDLRAFLLVPMSEVSSRPMTATRGR